METTYQHIHADLIAECKRGDAKAQVRIYELYFPAMYNTALRIMHDSAEAEDMMQEAFLDAFRKIASFKGESTFGAWLKRIVVNKCLNQIKRNKLQYSSIQDEREVLALPEEDDNAQMDYKVEEVREGIRQLPEGYRVIISLYLLEGYDHEEIGQVLNISASTSRSQYTRAKVKLKDWLLNRKK